MIYPMYAMVLLTLFIGLCAVYFRVKSVTTNAIKPRAYRLMDGDFPEPVVVSTRCFNNQFELPVLFYAGALAFIITGQTDNTPALTLAWTFVVLRVLHALIHMTYNHLLHRMIVYWSGFAVLIAFWTVVLMSA